jgi:hypothetical protein
MTTSTPNKTPNAARQRPRAYFLPRRGYDDSGQGNKTRWRGLYAVRLGLIRTLDRLGFRRRWPR